MAELSPNRTYNSAPAVAGSPQLRDLEELEGTLLPTASPVEPSAPLESDLSSPLLACATPIPIEASAQYATEEAPLIPPVPTDNRYKRGDNALLAEGEQKGRLAATEEKINVLRSNQKIPAYNNQAELDLDRANQVARMENIRERRLVNPPIATPPLDSLPGTPKEESPYFKPAKGGYEVKQYDVGEYDAGYSYEMSQYKSDYD